VLDVTCRACEGRWSGAAGVALLVESLSGDSAALWRSVKGLGGAQAMPAAVLAKLALAPPAEECPHHLTWLRLELQEALRGCPASLTFRCAGCRAGWPMEVGLLKYLERVAVEREQLRSAIRQLGGVIE
jgi:hypothetical protein